MKPTSIFFAASVASAFGIVLASGTASGEQVVPPPKSDSNANGAQPVVDGGVTQAAPGAAPSVAAPSPVPAQNDAGAPITPATNNVMLAGSAETARLRYANTWDFNLEGGGGYVFGGVDKWTGFVRARPGVLLVRDDSFFQFGATAEYLGMLKRPAFGLQAEYLNLSLGGWLQLGGSLDTKARPGFNAAVGLSVVGIEAQVREFDGHGDPAFVLLAKLRLPIGILAYAIRTKK